MEEDVVSTAYLVVHSVSMFGIVSNFIAVVTIYKKRDMHNPFGILCAAMAANNVLVLTQNSIWYAMPDDEIFKYASTLSRIVGYVELTQFNFGCNIHVSIALNRMIAVIFPMSHFWTESRTFIGLTFLLLLAFLQNLPMILYDDIWFCYDRPRFIWHFANSERGRFFENKINIIPCIINFVLTTTFDLITLYCLRSAHAKVKQMSSQMESRKRDLEFRLFIQAFSQSLPVVVFYCSFMFLTPKLTTHFTRFLSTTISWHFVHFVDGLTLWGKNHQQFIMNRSILLIALVGVAAVFGCSSKPSGGGCGCKAKARGVLKLDGDNPVTEDFGFVEGLSLWGNPKPPANVSLEQAHDPNFHFKSCCAGRGLSAACTARCNYQTYNQDLLQKMLIGADECPLDSLPEMHFCAAQGRDHSTCCRAHGVDATVAGDKCLVFCDQVPDKFTPIDYTYAACFGKFDEMKQCFHGTINSKAKAFFRHH